jgi:hypothetical protein
LLFEHDLFQKPVSTFRDHALILRAAASSLRTRGSARTVAPFDEQD